MEPLFVTLAEARKISGIGTTRLYQLLGSGALTARKAGTRTLIDMISLRRYLDSLPLAQIRTGKRRAP